MFGITKDEKGFERRGPAGAAAEPRAALRKVAPAVDIYEREDGLVLVADLPGVPSDGVGLDIDKDVLTITARFLGGEALPGEATWSELGPREYYRAFALGDDLDAARISATMRNGVLELLLPKAERAKTRKIQVDEG
jgi:HSP20 family molecular chaperone IbpA